MSSAFDSDVRRRREATPWTQVDFLRFADDVAAEGAFSTGNWHEGPRNAPARESAVTLRVMYRHSVSSGRWYELEWTGADGGRHEVSAQYFDLLMWRAAHVEAIVRQKLTAAEQATEKEEADNAGSNNAA